MSDNSYYTNPVRAFLGLTAFWKVAVFAVMLSLSLGLGSCGVQLGESRANARAKAERAENLKKAQAALAAMDAANRRAEAKEAQAALLEQQIAAKSKDAAAAQAKLEQESKTNEAQNQQAFENDKAYINSDLSACDRCRDVCARLARSGSGYACGPDDCAEACAAGNP
jgi:hypothetical protein